MTNIADIESLVRRVYPRRGWRGVHAEAPWLSRDRIAGIATRLHVRSMHGRPVAPPTPEQEAEIRALYAERSIPSKSMLRDLSKRIGFPRARIAAFAASNGISGSKGRPTWIPAELAILRRTAGMPLADAVKALESAGFIRSRSAVANTRSRHRIGLTPNGDASWTTAQMAKMIGCDPHTLLVARKAGKLRARPACVGQDGIAHSYRVTARDMVDWIENGASKIISNRVSERVYALMDATETSQET